MTEERWKPIGIAHDGQTLLVNGVSVWDTAWQSQTRAISLTNPQYPSQVQRASAYAWPDADPPLLLAIAEISMNVYAFAVSPPTAEVVRG